MDCENYKDSKQRLFWFPLQRKSKPRLVKKKIQSFSKCRRQKDIEVDAIRAFVAEQIESCRTVLTDDYAGYVSEITDYDHHL